LLLLWRRPLVLLRLNDGLQRYLDLHIGGRVVPSSLLLRFPTGIVFLHYHSLVLNAWVKQHAEMARKHLHTLPTFQERAVYVDLPVLWRGESQSVGPAELQPLFAAPSAVLLVWGEGGSGKTTLACQMAFWALAENRAARTM